MLGILYLEGLYVAHPECARVIIRTSKLNTEKHWKTIPGKLSFLCTRIAALCTLPPSRVYVGAMHLLTTGNDYDICTKHGTTWENQKVFFFPSLYVRAFESDARRDRGHEPLFFRRNGFLKWHRQLLIIPKSSGEKINNRSFFLFFFRVILVCVPIRL